MGFLVRNEKMIKRFFLTAIFLCSVLAFSKSDGGVVSGVLGLNVDCGDACQLIPLNVLTCITGCPSIVGPSFTEANVLWGYNSGPLCMKSIDSGHTWSNCPDANFSTLGKPLTGNVGSITGAADGSVIAVVSDNTTPPDICTIVRSTNGGATWSIVFQSSPMQCTLTVGGSSVDSNHLACLGTGECVLVFNDSSVNRGRVIRSVDNGQTWSVVFNQSIISDTPTTVAYNGSVGIACRFADSVLSPSTRGMKFNGIWSDSGFLSTTGIFCGNGAFVFNNVPYIAGVRVGTPVDRVIVNGLTGNVVTPITLPGVFTDSTVSTVAAVYKDKAVYLGAPDATNGNRIGVWVSLSLSGPYTKVFTAPSAMTSVAGGGGFVHPVSNCVYLYNRFNVVGFCP
jgi:hypothetical protein